MYDATTPTNAPDLPVGPVCNPGIDAIKAALYPEDTGLLLLPDRRHWKVLLCKTADQHYQNERVAAQAGEVHGPDTQN